MAISFNIPMDDQPGCFWEKKQTFVSENAADAFKKLEILVAYVSANRNEQWFFDRNTCMHDGFTSSCEGISFEPVALLYTTLSSVKHVALRNGDEWTLG